MKLLLSIGFLALCSVSVVAQSDGDTQNRDGQMFTFNNGIWVHDALGDSYTITDDYTAVHKDDQWKDWYEKGNATTKSILDLGPNIVFESMGTDGAPHVYAVFINKKLAAAAVSGGSAAIATGLGGTAATAVASTGATILGMSATTAAVVGGAVVAGAVIVDNNNSNSASKTKR